MPKQPETIEGVKKKTIKDAKALLVGRKIVDVHYMTQEDILEIGWYQSGIMIHLDDGTLIYAMQDNEGNGPGAIVHGGEKKNTTFYTL